MEERHQAKHAIQHLSEVERDALEGLVLGESVRDLSLRRSITLSQATGLRKALKRKLGVRYDAEAVRIGLIAQT